MNQSLRERALLKPESVFHSPVDVIDAPGWSNDDRVEILMSWQNLLIELQRATDENMAKMRGSSDVGDRLQEVTQALSRLGHSGGTPPA